MNIGHALIHKFRQAEDYFFRALSVKCFDIQNEATAYMTGVPIQDLNPVYITKNTSSVELILNQCKQLYNDENLSFVTLIPEEFCVPQVEDTLKNLGYIQTGKSVAMVLALDNNEIVSNADICLNDQSLESWMFPLIGAFQSTFEIISRYANAHKNAIKKEYALKHFSLYIKGDPVASMTMSVHGDVSRIDDVGTLPEFQGRGYATRLVSYGLYEAKRLGAAYCFLESSDSGISIYQKSGFKPLFKNNIYSYSRQE